MKTLITAFSALTLLASFPASAQDPIDKKKAQPAANLRLEVWQVPQLTAIEILDEARGQADSVALTVDLRAGAKKGDSNITLIALPSITSRSGQRAKVEAGENDYISGYKVDAKSGQEVPVKSTYLTGTSLEVDPVIGADNVTIDINLAFNHALKEPVLKERTISGPVSGKDLVVQEVEENCAEISTTTTMVTGQTRLIGSIPAKNDNILLVFLYAEVLQVNP